MADYVYSADLELKTSNLKQVARNIQSTIGNIKGNINVNVSRGTQTNISNVNRSLKDTEKNMKSVAKETKGTVDTIESFGKASALAIRRFAAFTVVTTGFISLSRNIKASLQDAIDFQREVVKISQVTGKTISGLQGLTNEITRLSTSLGVSSNELLTASRTLSQTGLAAKDVEKSLQAIAKSDLSPTFDSIVDTTEGSIAIFRQFGVSVDQLEAKLSSINSVSKSFAIESSDIITAVRRAGGAFSAAGGNFEEFIALLTSVRSTTRESAESIATGFRTIFTRLQRTRTQNFLKDLGIDLRDAQGQFVGPYKAIGQLSKALNELQGTDPRFAQIIEELGGFRQVTKVIPLIKQYGVAQKALAVAQTQQNSLAQDAETAQQALAVQIAKVREEFEALIRTIADSDSFKAVTTAVIAMTKAAIGLANALTPLLPAITALAGFGAINFGRRFFKGPEGFFATLANPEKKKSGGIIPGVGNSDTVPALLTPGEFVLSKKAVAAAGKSNLIDFNNAARFNTGGLVGGTSTSTKAIGLAAGVQFGASLLKLEGETRDLANAVTAIVGQFGLMNTAVNTSTSVIERQNKIRQLSDIQERRKGIPAQLGEALGNEKYDLNRIAFKKSNLKNQQNLLSNQIGLLSNDSYTKNGKTINPAAAALSKITGTPEALLNPGQLRDFEKKRDEKRNQLIRQRLDVQRNIVDAEEQEYQVKQRIERIDNSILKVKKSNAALAKRIAAEEAKAKAVAIGSNIAIGAAAIAGVAGSNLTNKANDRIAAGVDATGQAGAGGALTGAATGAALGAVAGPWGIAVGAAAGAAFGFVTAMQEATNKLREVKLEQSVSQINTTLQRLNKSDNPLDGAQDINRRISDIRGQQLVAASDSETAKNIKADINSFLPELSVFIDKIAQSSKTLNEFDKVGSKALEFLALQQGLSFDDLRQQIKDQIDIQNKAKKVDQELLAQRERESQRIREINSIMQALAKSAKQLKEYQANVGLQNSLVSGSTAGQNFYSTVSQASDLSLISDIAEFKREVNDFGSLFGEAGKRLASEVASSAEVAKTLPDILEKLKRETDSGFSKEGELISNLNKELDGIPVFIREAIIKQAREIIGSEGKDATLISEVRKDSNAVAKKLLESLNGIGDVLAQAGQALAERKNVFTQGISDVQSAIDTRNQYLFKAIEARQERIKAKVPPDKELTLQQKNLEFFRKLNVVTEGGPNTVSAIESRLNGPNGARARLQAARSNFQKLSSNGEGTDVTKVAKEFDAANREVVRLTNSLKFLADSTIKVTALQEELAKAEAQRNANKSLLKVLAFGSAEEKVKLAQQSAAYTQLAQLSKAGKLGDIDKNLLAQLGQTAAPFFQQFQNQEYGGFKVKDLEKEVIKQIVGPQLATQLEPNQKEQDLKSQLDKALEEREKANLVLAKQTQMSIEDLLARMGTLFTTFINNLQKTFLENEKASAVSKQKDAESKIGGVNNEIAKSAFITSKTGLNTKEQLQLKANQNQIKELNKLDKNIGGISSIARDPEAYAKKFENTAFKGFTLDSGLAGSNAFSQGISGEEAKTKIEAARGTIAKDLISKGFNQEQINQFNANFDKFMSEALKWDGVTAQEASDIVSMSLRDIVKTGLEDASKRRTDITRNLVDNQGISGDRITAFKQAQISQGEDINELNPDLLNTSKQQVNQLIKERDEAKKKAADLDAKINSLPRPQPVPPVTNNIPPVVQNSGQQFNNFAINEIGDIYNSGIDRFESATERFQQVASIIPSSLELGGAVKVEVIVNGAEVLSKLGPSLETMIVERVNTAIENINNASKAGVPASPIPYDPKTLV